MVSWDFPLLTGRGLLGHSNSSRSFTLLVQVTADELGTKHASLNALEHMAASLKGHVTPAIVERLDRTLEEARAKWAEVEKGTETRKEGMYGPD